MWNINNDSNHLADGALLVCIKINNDGDIDITDFSPYAEWFENKGWTDHYTEEQICSWHQVIEKIVLDDNNIDEENKEIEFESNSANSYADLRFSHVVKISNDGHYIFRKLILSNQNHPYSNANSRIYYDTDTDKVVYTIDDNPEHNIYYDPEDDFDTIYDKVTKPQIIDNCYSVEKEIFSIYNLIKCYLLKEKYRIQNYFSNGCTKGCDKVASNAETEADILLAAIFVLKDLIVKGDFDEAQRILNGLHTCNSLCKDYSNNLKGCNCGKN